MKQATEENPEFYLLVEAPSKKTNKQMKISEQAVTGNSSKIFQVWYKQLGCKMLEIKQTSIGIMYLDEEGMFNESLTQSKVIIDSKEETLAGDMILTKGRNSQGDIEFFTSDDQDIIDQWVKLFQQGFYINKEPAKKGVTTH